MFRTIPNQITLARIASVPLLMFLILAGSESRLATILAIALFFLAALSDFADGILARSFQQTSTFGKFADPIADKLLIVGALLCFVQLGDLAAAPVMVIIAREFLVTGLRILAIAEGTVVSASVLGKMKMISHLWLVLAVLVDRSFALGPAGDLAIRAVLYLAITLSLVSGIEYAVRLRHLFRR
jgi:CDP-diacylglycerol--glycerol-3-phosphate 3-phosphatidyltransferase